MPCLVWIAIHIQAVDLRGVTLLTTSGAMRMPVGVMLSAMGPMVDAGGLDVDSCTTQIHSVASQPPISVAMSLPCPLLNSCV